MCEITSLFIKSPVVNSWLYNILFLYLWLLDKVILVTCKFSTFDPVMGPVGMRTIFFLGADWSTGGLSRTQMSLLYGRLAMYLRLPWWFMRLPWRLKQTSSILPFLFFVQGCIKNCLRCRHYTGTHTAICLDPGCRLMIFLDRDFWHPFKCLWHNYWFKPSDSHIQEDHW